MKNNKIKVLSGIDMWHFGDCEELKIKKISVCDGPNGLRKLNDSNLSMDNEKTYRATCFPSPSTIACSYDEQLVGEFANAIAKECIQAEVDVILAPGVNIKRSPLGGRNFEYFSEDPLLSGVLGTAFVKGVQQFDVGACLKHYVANSQEHARMINDSIIDERALNEIYLKAFEMIIKNSNPYCLMTSYNKVNGTYVSQHDELLGKVRKDFNYQGVIISDWGSIDNRVKSIKSGVDVEMPNSKDFFEDTINQAIEKKYINEEIEHSVVRLQNLSSKVSKKIKVSYEQKNHNDLVTKIALESAVLLKNEDNTLPISKEQKILVLGELFEKPRIQGRGSCHVKPTNVATPKIAFDNYGVKYDYLKGYNLDGTSDNGLIRKANKVAEQYDKIIIFVGMPDSYETEGIDKNSLKLPECQVDLIDALTLYNDNVILVINSGGVIEMPFEEDVKSILHMHLYGQTGAYAIPKLLFGEVSPSGRLAETYPIFVRDNPSFYDFANDPKQSIYIESVFVGYRYYQRFDKQVCFPFGFGLSYSEFAYSNLKVNKINDLKYEVSFDVKNTGKYPAKEVVQIYLGHNNSSIYRPVKELKAFKKVFLEVNETKNIKLEISDFAIYDSISKSFKVENGKYNIYVSKSCIEDLLVHEIEVINQNDFEKQIEVYPSYFSNSGFTALDFEKIYGKKLPKSVPFRANAKDIDYSSCLKEISKNFLASLLVRGIKEKLVLKMMHDHKNMSSIIESIDYMPLRNVIIMANDIVDVEYADKILEICNSEFLEGLKIYLKLIFKSKKKQ